MSPRRFRLRLLDLVVTFACMACVAVPFVAISHAEERPQVEIGGDVDQSVASSGMLSYPIAATFQAGGSGTVNGSVQWDLFTTSTDGMKLTVSSDRTPAMRDAQNGIDIGDYGAEPKAWSVDGSARRFGFTVQGDIALGRFAGDKWRGFEGGTSVEVGRKKSPLAQTRTTVKLRGEFSSALPSDAKPTANIYATAVVNL
ncbi:MAG: hypothetical protein JWN72_1171 [Thermoleophilia bacterium]|nr:hypothetical protein [Thermoleophilia bacterium]